MGKPKSYLAKKIWPTERKLINRIITKEKGYHNKPYPAKNKIPTEALHSVSGALDVLDKAEKKKPNKGHIRKYRKNFEKHYHLPEAHYFAFKAKEKKTPAKKLTAKEREEKREEALRKKFADYKPSAATLARQKETKEQRMARLQASLDAARRNFVKIDEKELQGITPTQAVKMRFPGIRKDDLGFGGRF